METEEGRDAMWDLKGMGSERVDCRAGSHGGYVRGEGYGLIQDFQMVQWLLQGKVPSGQEAGTGDHGDCEHGKWSGNWTGAGL